MNVLLTGFEPFDKDPLNPSWEVARALDGWQPAAMNAACTVRAVQLPCVFGDAIARLDEAMAQWQPTLVICLGLAGGRTEITPERVAINVDDARIPDNAGRQPVDTAVQADGPAAYFSTLPIKAMVRDMRAAGVQPHFLCADAPAGCTGHWYSPCRWGGGAWRVHSCACLARAGGAAPWHAQHGPGHAGAGLADRH